MNRFYAVLAIGAALASTAASQEQEQQRKAAMEKLQAELQHVMAESKFVYVNGGAMGPTVKGAPYSAVEITESNQVLADGTRIHNEHQTTVYRDSEGRVRRETPDQITIWDPVNNATYFLDPKNQKAQKSVMRTFTFNTRDVKTGPGDAKTAVEVRMKDGLTSATVNGEPVDAATLKKMEAEAKVAAAGGNNVMIYRRLEPGGVEGGMVARKTLPANRESLGNRMMEGVNADGVREVTKLDVGAIGNDRPIEISNESWYSPDLQMNIMTRHNDPRSGEEIFRLTNINRSEPPADLFQVPAGYQVVDRK
jgi:hypothetical protein